MSNTPETDAAWKQDDIPAWYMLSCKLEHERNQARSLEGAVDTIMSAPMSDILRLFLKRGVIPQFTTMNV